MSKGFKRNKDSDFEGSGDNDSDDDFEKDFKSKKNKKNKPDPGTCEAGESKKLRDRRSNREDPFEKEIKKAIELSLSESSKENSNKCEKLEKKENSLDKNKTEEKMNEDGDDDGDFIKQTKKNQTKTEISNQNETVPSEISECIENPLDNCNEIKIGIDSNEVKVEKVNKSKKTPSKSTKKKAKSFDDSDQENEDNYLDQDSGEDDDFKNSKSKKKSSAKKKTTPGSNKKKSKKSEEPIKTLIPEVLEEKNLNKESIEETKKEKVVVSLKFEEKVDETKVIVPNLKHSDSNSSRKSLSSIESIKKEKKNLNNSLNLNSVSSPLGRIEIKTAQPCYRVGLSRNSKVKSLHPNMGNIMNKEWTQHVDDYSSNDESNDANSNLLGDQKSKIESCDYTPLNNKVMQAGFDPRSPSSGIVRTPICYLNDQKSEIKKSASSVIDPRSPTNDYKRTPIHLNTVNLTGKNEYINDFLDDSSSSLDNSSLVMAESSVLLQHVPENTNGNSNLNDSPLQYGLKIASSNMPRHILQRKQVEKLNRKKLIDLQDKEN
ncbi:unnamed protein product [Brachionus calyciflorus]|uniref:RAD51 interacting motif domain-containing protein n=1 Tax=Brachionus calyciflorus TaxID=104777 RepID=A0A814BJ55_9BILA|nr:unnamed protein product [Brachionus calyciflorus]